MFETPREYNTDSLASADLPSHYKILDSIGTGGMGKVYLATDTRLDRKVAIKVCDRQAGKKFGDNTDLSASSLSEAKLMAKLSHANIVNIYDLIVSDDKVALVMEYVEGSTLDEYQKLNRLTLENKLKILLNIAKGLDYAHDKGIVHCDLKPANILISSSGVAKITDFGISRLKAASSQKNPVSFGSKYAMSPEQIQGSELDHRSDLFSFGLLAFQLIAERHPFAADGEKDIAQVILKEQAADANHISPQLPADLIELLNKLLKKNVRQRPQTTREVSERLSDILQNLIYQNEETTQPISQAPASRNLTHLALVPFALAIFAYLLFQLFETESKPVDYIAVLPPEFTVLSDTPAIQRSWVKAAIENALNQMVLAADDKQLIPKSEFNRIEDNKLIAQVTGATKIVSTEIECINLSCNIGVSVISSASNTVESNLSLPFNIDNLLSKSDSFYAQLNSLLSKQAYAARNQGPVAEKDYVEFIDIYARLNAEGLYHPELLEKLKLLILRSPHLYSAYSLYGEISLTLYHQSGDEKLVDEYLQVLNASPSEYKNTIPFYKNMIEVGTIKSDSLAVKENLAILENRGISGYEKHLVLSNVYRFENNLDLSIKHSELALGLRRNHRLLFNLAFDYFTMGNLDAARARLDQVLKVNELDNASNQLMADINLIEGDFETAISLYLKVMSNNPEPLDINSLSVAYLLSGDYEKSLEYASLNRGLFDNIIFALNYADLMNLVGRREVANQFYNDIVNSSIDDGDFYSMLSMAQAYAHLNKPKEAIKMLNAAMKISYDNGYFSYVSSLVYTLIGEYNSALVQAENTLDSGYGKAWFNLPWFSPLCAYPSFEKMLASDKQQSLCEG